MTKLPGRSRCPISVALDLLGDRWSLLVVRDLIFAGKRHFGEFLASPEGIATNILTDRLERLGRAGLVERDGESDRGGRPSYRITGKGLDLLPVLLELMSWSGKHERTGMTPAFRRRLERNRDGIEREIRAAVAAGRPVGAK